jgi:hypothetical protein
MFAPPRVPRRLSKKASERLESLFSLGLAWTRPFSVAQFHAQRQKDFNTHALGGFPQMSHRFPQIFINAPYGGFPQAIRLDFHRWYMPIILILVFNLYQHKKYIPRELIYTYIGIELGGTDIYTDEGKGETR